MTKIEIINLKLIHTIR